ncbi:hypothetical protein CDL15_Pgr023649 [Punica granatum]|uniref:Arabinogalactan peptide 16-like n=1 Tax=Punica granatum TaxID=22663 RepID=A0A218W746_PUNGR|nr:hypothetical protein CDL15_Pgr023649 [Punica granatum]
MASFSLRTVFSAMAMFALACAICWPPSVAKADSMAPAPAPASDGTSIDQGIAYVLMLMAVLLTYLIHPLDASSSFFF